MLTLEIPDLPVLVATAISCIISTFWYSPKLFGNVWARAHHFEPSQIKPSFINYINAILINLIMVIVMAKLIHLINIRTFKGGIELSFLIWIGFIVTSHISGVIWAKKPFKVFLIDVGNIFVTLLISSILLVLWK